MRRGLHRHGACTFDLRAAHVEVGLHGDTLLDQRGSAAVLRNHHDAGGRVRRAVHVVGHVEVARMGGVGTTIAAAAARRTRAVAARGVTAIAAVTRTTGCKTEAQAE